MTRSVRTLRKASLVLIVLPLVAGCFSWQRPVAGVPLNGNKVRVATFPAAPIPLVAHEPASFADCRIRSITGRVSATSGDTLTLRTPAAKGLARGDRTCRDLWKLQSVQLIRAPNDALRVRRYSARRTGTLFVTMATLGYIIMEKDDGRSSSGFYRIMR